MPTEITSNGNTTTIINGVEFSIGWRFKDEDTDDPIPLLNYSILVQIRESKNSSVILSFDQDSPEITFNPVDGEVFLLLPPSVTRNYRQSKGVIDCWVYNDLDTTGIRSSLFNIVVDRGVSRL
jgi:hypothetical protein